MQAPLNFFFWEGGEVGRVIIQPHPLKKFMVRPEVNVDEKSEDKNLVCQFGGFR